jgi:hypothetical protein
MFHCYQSPKSLKRWSTTRLARLLVDSCKSLELNSELVELPISKIASARTYLGKLPPQAYQDVFDLSVAEIRRRDCKGCFLEFLFLPTLTQFLYEASNVDLMRTICISQVMSVQLYYVTEKIELETEKKGKRRKVKPH